MRNTYRRLGVDVLALLCCAAFLGLASGCAVPPMYSPGKVDLSEYDKVTVQMFEMGPKVTMPADMNKLMCDQIAKTAKGAAKGKFGVVRLGLPEGKTNELIVHGRVLVYQPGSQVGRALLFVAGAASFKAEVHLKDGASGELLDKREVSSLFAIGGLIGGAVSHKVLVKDLGAAIGRGVGNARKRATKPTKVASSP